jgi:hypothetical protein
MPVGLLVCRSGWTSGWGCGAIHRAQLDFYDGTSFHYDTWEVSQVSNHGDSGAGYVALESDDTYVRPAGILWGGDATSTYYYPVFDDWAISVHVCVTATC